LGFLKNKLFSMDDCHVQLHHKLEKVKEIVFTDYLEKENQKNTNPHLLKYTRSLP
jgi:hypothetical protein